MTRKSVRYTTIVTDIILINLAFGFAYVVRYNWQWFYTVPENFYVPFADYVDQLAVLNGFLIVAYGQNHVWRRRRGEFWIDEVARIATATAAGMGLFIVATFFFQPTPFSRLMLGWTLLFIVIFVGLGRLVRRNALHYQYRRGKSVDLALIVGAGETGRGVIRTLLVRSDLGFKVIGYLDGRLHDSIGLERIPNLGALTDLPAILDAHPRLHTVFIALPSEMHQEMADATRICQQHGVLAQVIPDLLQLNLNNVEFNNMAGIPLLSVRDVGISRAKRLLKRLLDLTIIAITAIPALLVGGLIALAIRWDSKGPIFYTSARVGRNGKPFMMVKFRSMSVGAEHEKEALMALNEADGPLFKIKDDPRQTRVGRFLRKSSLDELPQLLNVFWGHMSLVGPRPPLQEEVDQYQLWQRQRLSVIGGATGLWQISGRSDLTFDELCLLDIYYIENWSIMLDVRILLQTIPHLFFGRGAY